jgi:hypothetical protein
MFVDKTAGGELARRLQEVENRLGAITGYGNKIIETSGSQLRRLLPWSGRDCGRLSCYTCAQDGESLEDCKWRNILYESFCTVCNPDIQDKKFGKKKLSEVNGVYVGESGRSIFERAGEHWTDRQNQKEDSHMVVHWATKHADMPEPPKFLFKVVSSFKDALT